MPLVLIVDDHAPLRQTLATVLSAKGVEVLQAANGEEADRITEGRRPDLVVMDLLLPGCNGIEVLDRLLSTGKTSKVVAISSTMTDSLAKLLTMHGVVACYSKTADAFLDIADRIAREVSEVAPTGR